MTQLAKIGGGKKTAKQIRKARAKRLILLLVLWVGIPTLLSIGYYGLWATPQYESVSVFSVHSGENANGLETLAMIIPTSNPSRDASIVAEYVSSRSMLDVLIRDHRFLEHYVNPDADWHSRLSSQASSEEIYDYYLDKIEISQASQSGSLTLRVRAYSAKEAQRFAQTIMTLAENMVNRMTERERTDSIQTAEKEVILAQTRLGEAQKEVMKLQREGAEINPGQSAEALLSIRAQLETELAKARAELDTLAAVMHKNAPKVIQMRQRVRSLTAQVRKQNARLVDDKHSSIHQSIARFEPAVLEKEFAEQALGAALKALEMARLKHSHQQRYVVVIAEPSQPNSATHPKRLWGISTVFVVSLALMLVCTMLGAAIREHAKF